MSERERPKSLGSEAMIECAAWVVIARSKVGYKKLIVVDVYNA